MTTFYKLMSLCINLFIISLFLDFEMVYAQSTKKEYLDTYNSRDIGKEGQFYNFEGNVDKKVLMHYMGWYGSGECGRHWGFGHAHTPLMGYYNSRDWPVLDYHMLLSWSHGIDGLIINIKDHYDDQTVEQLHSRIKKFHNLDSLNFNYVFSISYDDQGMPNDSIAKLKFNDLMVNIQLNTNNLFLHNGSVPAIFVFNYPDSFLTAQEYNDALISVFDENKPEVLWNDIDPTAIDYVNAFYPWIGPGDSGWDPDGLNWGRALLDSFYTKANRCSIDYVSGSVWAGFDDRKNESWGEKRWMDRQNGAVYNSTWSFVHNYTGRLPLNWVVLETWNDWNEGTELEPSVEDDYQYLDLTTEHANTFKKTSIRKDSWKKEVAYLLYQFGSVIESGAKDSTTYYPLYEQSITSFLLHGRDSSSYNPEDIVNVDSISKIIDSYNLALNKPVVSSSNDSIAKRAVDGNPYTRWSSAAGDPQWIYVDLRRSTEIRCVVLHWDAAYAKSYQIQVSNDADSWTDIYSTTTGDGGIDEIIASANARYVRMYGTEKANSSGFSLSEFEVNGKGTIPKATYKIISKFNGKVLEVADSSKADAANVQQWDYHGGDHQKWIVEYLGNGYYKLRAAHSEKVLDVAGHSMDNGGNIQQWSDNALWNQQWEITGIGEGFYKIVSRESGKCVDVAGWDTTNGGNIHQWDYLGTDNQKWSFEKVDCTVDLDMSQGAIIPKDFQLLQNYPNPFNPMTMIQFNLPDVSEVTLVIYDLLGREVIWLVDSKLASGSNMIRWDGQDRHGRSVASGLYIYRIHAINQKTQKSFAKSHKMLMFK